MEGPLCSIPPAAEVRPCSFPIEYENPTRSDGFVPASGSPKGLSSCPFVWLRGSNLSFSRQMSHFVPKCPNLNGLGPVYGPKSIARRELHQCPTPVPRGRELAPNSLPTQDLCPMSQVLIRADLWMLGPFLSEFSLPRLIPQALPGNMAANGTQCHTALV
jgi:hypothetical protein